MTREEYDWMCRLKAATDVHWKELTEWRDQGLLGEKAAGLIDRIVAVELQKEAELQKDKVFQIEI